LPGLRAPRREMIMDTRIQRSVPSVHRLPGVTMGAARWIMAALVLAAVTAGCAKQPASITSALTSPAPGVGVPPAPSAHPSRPASGQREGPSSTATRSTSGAAGRPAVTEFVAVSELPDIYFDFDRYDLRPSAQRTLVGHATWLRAQAKALVLIEGHCDERGTNEYNVALGERRARAAMDYLVSRGVDARRITVVSYGEERPQCREHDEPCWARNRRARFLVKTD
jgi:peptidoglycan-associated lipoprotein